MFLNMARLLVILTLGVACGETPAPASVPTQPTALMGGELVEAKAVAAWERESFLVIDLRSAESYNSVRIPGAMPVFFERLGPLYPGLAEHPKKIPVLIVADSDEDALRGTQMLTAAGYDTKGLIGGVSSWEAAGMSVEKNTPN